MEHYFQKYKKGGASHPKETEKWTVSFERFLSLHKLTLSWHKERIKKRNENKKAFFITVINISIVKPEQFCARKEKKTRGVTLNAIQMSVHFITIMIQSFLYILFSW